MHFLFLLMCMNIISQTELAFLFICVPTSTQVAVKGSKINKKAAY